MPTLIQRDFSRGWIPSDDAINGREDGLLRMDNCSLDETGAVVLHNGTDKISPALANAIEGVYSTILNGVKHRYAGHGTTVVKDVNEADTFGATVLSGGASGFYAFGVALGQVLVCSGTQKKKDDGSTIRDIGVEQPGAAPSLTSDNRSIVNITGTIPAPGANLVAIEGTGLTGSGTIGITTDVSTGRARVKHIDSIDTGFSGRYHAEDDWEAVASFEDSDTAKSFRVEYYLASGSGDATGDNPDMYFIELQPEDDPRFFTTGATQVSRFKTKRKNFKRVGDNTDLDWGDVETVVYSWSGGNSEACTFTRARFLKFGELTGVYDYRQVNVYNNGTYSARSLLSATSESITVESQDINVVPDAPSGWPTNPNEIWIFRRKHTQPGITGYDTWYRVAVRNSTIGFVDSKSDRDVLQDNVKICLNATAVPNGVLDIAGMYFGRMLYMTADDIHVSETLNPDSIEQILGVSGEESEINLWVRKIQDSTLLVGTTRDVYVVAGDGRTFPDGTVNFTIRPLGIDHPPISQGAALYNHQVIYMASDGWRIIRGSITESITGETRLLFEGETRHGQLGVLIKGQNTVTYRPAVAKGKLWAISTLTNGTQAPIFVYDFKKGYWSLYNISPRSIFAEEDGTLIAGFADPGDRFVREINTGTTIDSGGANLTWLLRTTYLNAGRPNNRKDLFTLKVYYQNSAGSVVTVKFDKDGDGTWSTIGTLATTATPVLGQFEVNGSTENLGKSFALELSGVSEGFKLFHWSLDYDNRPEQVSYLRIPPSNFGVAAKKKVRVLPLVIDTLGNAIDFTPSIDGAPKTKSAHTTSDRRTVFHYFTDDQNGIDIGGILNSSGDDLFEFYELGAPDLDEVFPVARRFKQFGPINFDKFGKLRRIDIRMIAGGTDVTWELFIDGASFSSGTITTVANVDDIYQISLAKNAKGNTCYLELADTLVFYPFWAEFRFGESDNMTDLKRIRVGNASGNNQS